MRKTKMPGLLNGREIRTRAHDAPLFEIKVPRYEAFKRSVQYAGSVKWNNCTTQMRKIQSYSQFKEVQKKSMLAPLERLRNHSLYFIVLNSQMFTSIISRGCMTFHAST